MRAAFLEINPAELIAHTSTVLDNAQKVIADTEVTRNHALICQSLLRASVKNLEKTKARLMAFTAELSVAGGKDWKLVSPDDLVVRGAAIMS